MERQRWDERYAAPDRTPLHDPNALVVEELSALRPGRALELAAGEGRHARWLAERGWHVVAVDFSEVGLRRAQQLTRSTNISFLIADLHTLPLPPARFDLVLATFFHPRPAERPALYPKLAQTLAPAGTTLFVTYATTHKGKIDPDFLMDPEATAGQLQDLGLYVTRADTFHAGDATLAVVRATKRPRPATADG